MEYTGRSGHNSPRNSFVELTAAQTLAVPERHEQVVERRSLGRRSCCKIVISLIACTSYWRTRKLFRNGDVGSRSDPRNQNDSSIQALLPETE
jgi:hypothetical protein